MFCVFDEQLLELRRRLEADAQMTVVAFQHRERLRLISVGPTGRAASLEAARCRACASRGTTP